MPATDEEVKSLKEQLAEALKENKKLTGQLKHSVALLQQYDDAESKLTAENKSLRAKAEGR
jgi:regulator of replication initiation timing